MAQKVTVQMVDDLDGSQSDDISTVTFGLDGVSYEIDLTDANATHLRATLEEFVTHARRTGGRIKRGTPPAGGGSTSAGRERARAIREWARENGYEVSDRGRIPAEVVEAFDAAEAGAGSKSRKRKSRSR